LFYILNLFFKHFYPSFLTWAIQPFETAFFNTKPHAAVRFQKPQRFYPPHRAEGEYMDETTVSVTEKVIGDTLYIIESAVSNTAIETAYEKLERLILGESEPAKLKLAS